MLEIVFHYKEADPSISLFFLHSLNQFYAPPLRLLNFLTLLPSELVLERWDDRIKIINTIEVEGRKHYILGNMQGSWKYCFMYDPHFTDKKTESPSI